VKRVSPILGLTRRIVTSLGARCEAESQPELIEKYETRVIGGSFLEILYFDFDRSDNFWQGLFCGPTLLRS
jgi:hypothetical protein